MFTELVRVTFEESANGAYVAFLLFLVGVPLLLLTFLVVLWRIKADPLRLPRYVRVPAFAVIIVLYTVYMYRWLAWDTYYEMRIAPAAGRFELTLLFPQRHVAFDTDMLEAVEQVWGGKGTGNRLVLHLKDGRRYRSPQETKQRVAEIYELLRRYVDRPAIFESSLLAAGVTGATVFGAQADHA